MCYQCLQGSVQVFAIQVNALLTIICLLYVLLALIFRPLELFFLRERLHFLGTVPNLV